MQSTKVFMIGWEYPPHNSGGLGVACDGLTRALAAQNTQIYFTLPYAHTGNVKHLSLLGCVDPTWTEDGLPITSPPFGAYQANSQGFLPLEVEEMLDSNQLRALPLSELDARVNDYANLVALEEKKVDKKVDVVHAHDWMSFPAAMKIRQQSNKPIIAHVHSTEFDRVPHGQGSPFIHQVEYEGLLSATHIIAVSTFTKQLLVNQYSMDPKKISVVHNGIDPLKQVNEAVSFAQSRPVIVFMGRLTMQKGGEYFLQLAQRLLEQIPNALFVVAGNGDMYHQLLFKTAYDRLSAHVLFSGFVRDRQRELLLNRADVFVMPSLSEPFGLVALEAAQRHTPVVVSKQSGVAEVLPSAVQIDFWDVDRMVQEISHLIKNPNAAQEKVQNQLADISEVTWSTAAGKVRDIYQRLFQKSLR
ncbi:glycosyltransferase family 4 protein [Candidatus Woesebacteria bacterium]|nr:glycosyltransferase family 4 protein [Candidatus Woesebacteria bacterium]